MFTKDVTFLYTSYCESDRVQKPVVVPTSYEKSDEEAIKTVPENNNYNKNCDIISDSDKDDEEKEENVFGQILMMSLT